MTLCPIIILFFIIILLNDLSLVPQSVLYWILVFLLRIIHAVFILIIIFIIIVILIAHLLLTVYLIASVNFLYFLSIYLHISHRHVFFAPYSYCLVVTRTSKEERVCGIP